MTPTNALVAIDFDDDVTPLTSVLRQWAMREDSHVTAVGVAPSLSSAIANPKIVSLAKNAEKNLLDDLRERVDAFGLAIEAPVDLHLLSGRTAEEVMKAAVLYKADFVVKLSHGAISGIEKKLIRKCPVPVWIINSDRQFAPQRIAVAVDNFDVAANKSQAELTAASLLRHSVDLARRFQITAIHIVHAWTPEAVGFLEHPRSGLSDEDVKNYIKEWEDVTYTWLEGFVSAANERYADFGVTFKPKLVMGDAKTALPAALKELDADILVIGSANRSGVSGLFIGNTAETVINRLDCSVYVVKPEDFRSVLAAHV